MSDRVVRRVIENLLPGVTVAETFEDVLDEPLYPEEEAAIARAVDKRRNEFRTVRACARRALHAIGVDRPPLVPGPSGAPIWPSGVVGSMTHCTGYRAAAVAPSSRVRSLGIDAEPGAPLPEGVLGSVALPEELEQLRALSLARPGTPWDRLLFSAKESVYKTWFPLTGRWLGFEEASVRLDPDGGLTATLLVPGPLIDGQRVDRFLGRWVSAHGLVVTGVRVPAPAR